MANTKISNEPSATALVGSEVVLGVQAASNVKVTINQIATLVLAGNAATATALATARTIDGQSFNGGANIAVIAPGTAAATAKSTPVDADQLPLVDSAAANVLKKLAWSDLKATLKTYFDTLYTVVGTQTAKAFYAGPTSGSAAAPTFRALAAADLPAAAEIVTLTYAATVSVDLTGHASNAVYRLTLTGNVTLNFTGGTDGQKALLELKQDGTGSRLVTLGTGIAYGTSITAFTATTTINKTDVLGILVNNTAYRVLAVANGY